LEAEHWRQSIGGRGMHWRWRDASEADGGGWSRQNLLEVGRAVGASECVASG
jgi:hypothetical protein